MSYDIYLTDPVTGDTLEAASKHEITGGTYCIGGTTRMTLNITWNYAEILYRVICPDTGVRKIYGMSGAESIPVIESAIAKLGDEVDVDYWKPTEGNAKRALHGLLALARMRPDGVWEGD